MPESAPDYSGSHALLQSCFSSAGLELREPQRFIEHARDMLARTGQGEVVASVCDNRLPGLVDPEDRAVCEYAMGMAVFERDPVAASEWFAQAELSLLEAGDRAQAIVVLSDLSDWKAKPGRSEDRSIPN